MNVFTKAMGTLLMISGVAVGLWLGVYVLFVGGIGQIVAGIVATPADGSVIAWGILRLLSCPLSVLPAFLIVNIGYIVFDYTNTRRFKNALNTRRR